MLRSRKVQCSLVANHTEPGEISSKPVFFFEDSGIKETENGAEQVSQNQILAGLPVGTGNLGGDGLGNFTGTLFGINFNNFAGNQFITIGIPEPGSIGLLFVAGLVAISRRRR